MNYRMESATLYFVVSIIVNRPNYQFHILVYKSFLNGQTWTRLFMTGTETKLK